MVPNKKLFIIQSNSFFINHFIYKHHKYILNPSRKQKKSALECSDDAAYAAIPAR